MRGGAMGGGAMRGNAASACGARRERRPCRKTVRLGGAGGLGELRGVFGAVVPRRRGRRKPHLRQAGGEWFCTGPATCVGKGPTKEDAFAQWRLAGGLMR